jgi:hypothetical protein
VTEVPSEAMDNEVKELLQVMRQENAETRKHLEAVVAEMRQENVAAHAETRQQLEAVAGAIRQENAVAHVETRQQLEAVAGAIRQENAVAHAETRRHFDVVAEGLRHELGLVAESVTFIGEKVDRLDARVSGITDDLDLRVTRLEAESWRRGQQ